MDHGDRRGGLADWLVVVLLTGASIFSFIDRFALSLLLEPIKHDLKLSDTQLGLLNGVAFGIFYAFLGLPLGWLADRWSRKGTIALGMTVWSIATGCCGFANSFAQLLTARIGVGAGEAGLSPASYAMIHDRFAGGRLNLATSVFQLGGVLGVGLSMLAAGLVYGFFKAGGGAGLPFIGTLQPWQQTFVMAALPGVFLIAAVLMLRDQRRVPIAAKPALHPAPFAGTTGRLTRIYALLFIGMAAEIGCTYALMGWIPTIMARELHWTTAQIGTAYGWTIMVAAPSGLLVGGWTTDILHKRRRADALVLMPLFAACASLPLLVLFGFVSGGPAILAVAACVHFILALPMGVAPALIQRITPGMRRSRISAVYVLACNVVGLGMGPVLIGWLASRAPRDPGALRAALCETTVPAAVLAVILLYALRSQFVGLSVERRSSVLA